MGKLSKVEKVSDMVKSYPAVSRHSQIVTSSRACIVAPATEETLYPRPSTIISKARDLSTLSYAPQPLILVKIGDFVHYELPARLLQASKYLPSVVCRGTYVIPGRAFGKPYPGNAAGSFPKSTPTAFATLQLRIFECNKLRIIRNTRNIISDKGKKR